MPDILSKEKPAIHTLQVLNKSEKRFLETKFGMMPVGSVLSNQCSLIPAYFSIYSNLPTVNEGDYNYLHFQVSHLVTLKITSSHTLIKLRIQVIWAY